MGSQAHHIALRAHEDDRHLSSARRISSCAHWVYSRFLLLGQQLQLSETGTEVSGVPLYL